MQIKSVRLKNVRCHEDLRLDFGPGVVALIGPNGAGKSSVLNAIGWALFDHLPYKQKEFVRRGGKKAAVTVWFEHSGTVYQVERSTDGLYALSSGDQALARGKADVLPRLMRIMGLAPAASLPRLWADSLGPPQGALTEGFGLPAKAAEDYWGRVLNLDVYRRVWAALRGPLALLGRRKAEQEGAIAAWESAWPSGLPTQAGELAQLLREAQAQEALLLDQLEQAKEEYERVSAAHARWALRREQVEEAATRLQAVEAELEKLERGAQEVQALPALEERLLALGEPNPALASEVTRATARRAELEAQLQALNDNLRAVQAELDSARAAREKELELRQRSEKLRAALVLETGFLARLQKDEAVLEASAVEAERALPELRETRACPWCKSALDEEAFKALEAKLISREGIREVKLPALRVEAEACTLSVRKLEQELERVTAELARIPSGQAFAELEAKLQEIEDRAVRGRSDLEELELELESLQAEWAEEQGKARQRVQLSSDVARSRAIQEHLGRLPALQQEKEMLMRQIAECQGEEEPDLNAAFQRSYDLANDLQAVRSRLETLAQAENLCAKIAEGKAKLARLEQVEKILVDCRRAIAEAGPLIAQATLSALARLASDFWQVMGKEGEVEWGADYSLSAGGRTFSILSGGEQVALALAVRLAIAQQASGGLAFLALDEPTVHLDVQAREGLMAAIARLDLSQTLLVTHDRDFAAAANQVIALGASEHD